MPWKHVDENFWRDMSCMNEAGSTNAEIIVKRKRSVHP